MADGITQVRLDDGTVVWARVTEAQELDGPKNAGPGGYEDEDAPYADSSYADSGAARRVAGMAGGLADTVRGVADSVRMGLAAARPDEVSVEFGIELSAKAGQVISLIADGESKASITVTLKWDGRREDPAAAGPEPTAHGAP
ncbi:CU044_2847 family protein [Streptomyces hesseae]|uniref:CU044_2847 family protein n=1 Tax=Streptomyces hesseae TaxID=3075519 RepID=A0ABU2SPS2_9ACTN|nr:CU044_2847 family protein [Streptomyces sp. DSM 40473]MDT0450966.1 CU044_2847 family protein [Streptomyces sp. DSM 40473]